VKAGGQIARKKVRRFAKLRFRLYVCKLGDAALKAGSESFGILASFITGYFIIEVAIMLTYARHHARHIACGNAGTVRS